VDWLSFEAEVIYWRGPAPFFFAPLPVAASAEVGQVARRVSYGWGMIPVGAEVNGVRFTTALFPKNDTYYLPLKDAVRRKAVVTAGDVIAVDMKVVPAAGG
jgi:hypothetical protein